MSAEKVCVRCNQRPVRGEGRSYCKQCHAEKASEWRAANPDKVRAARKRINTPEYVRKQNLKNNYGLTVEQYDLMVSAQGGVCAICGSAPSERLCVDHDHSNGQVRALLCPQCNFGIGSLGDDPCRLRAAAQYIEDHRAKDDN